MASDTAQAVQWFRPRFSPAKRPSPSRWQRSLLGQALQLPGQAVPVHALHPGRDGLCLLAAAAGGRAGSAREPDQGARSVAIQDVSE